MAVTVKLKYLRISPRKVRMVAKALKRKPVAEAEALLDVLRKKAVQPIKKLLNCAIAAAQNDFQLEKSNLFISNIKVDEGPPLKRSRARAMGRIFPIEKRTSHITLVLNEIEPSKKIKEIKKAQGKELETEKPEQKIKKSDSVHRGRMTRATRSFFQKPKLGKSIKKIFQRKAIE